MYLLAWGIFLCIKLISLSYMTLYLHKDIHKLLVEKGLDRILSSIKRKKLSEKFLAEIELFKIDSQCT
jgi:hypothetical protein